MNDLEKQLAQQQFKPVPLEWRRAVLRAAEQAAPPGGAQNHRVLPWWRILLWPSPRACVTLGAAWVMIILGHLTMPSVNSSLARPTSVAYAAAAAEARREQQRLLAELFPPERRAEPPTALPPRRRTERDSGYYFA